MTLFRKPPPQRTREELAALAQMIGAQEQRRLQALIPPAVQTNVLKTEELEEMIVDGSSSVVRHQYPSCGGIGGVCGWMTIRSADDDSKRRCVPTFCERHQETKRAVMREYQQRRRKLAKEN